MSSPASNAGQPGPAEKAAAISARLDRLPATRSVWMLVVLVALGWLFEVYDVYQTAYISPALIAAGLFKPTAHGLFGLSDQANFAAATFAGLFVGTLGFGWLPDRYGRRATFAHSMVWYSLVTAVMALQVTTVWIFAWRFVAAIGISIQGITINAYVSELVSKSMRGKAFATVHAIGNCGVPLLALFAWVLTPLTVAGISGWRIVVLIGSVGALCVWRAGAAIPESPRWLAHKGRFDAADRALRVIEQKVAADIGRALPEPTPSPAEVHPKGSLAEVFRAPYLSRTVMLVLLNLLLPIGIFGFGNWLPALVGGKGASGTAAMRATFLISLAAPVAPFLCVGIAERVERKWQIVGAALAAGAFGLLFAAHPPGPVMVILGLLIVSANTVLGYAVHAYQTELFPTRIRAQAVGFVYSWSRLSTMLSSYLIAFCLDDFGVPAVFALIAASMLVVVMVVAVMGRRTARLSLEQIAA